MLQNKALSAFQGRLTMTVTPPNIAQLTPLNICVTALCCELIAGFSRAYFKNNAEALVASVKDAKERAKFAGKLKLEG
jgi:hypothetical protein